MRFQKSRWVGNKWASIDITPVDSRYFMPLLSYLAQMYDFPMPSIIDKITGYMANFTIDGIEATIDIDTWDFSLAFAGDDVRDRVFDDLSALPDDFFGE